MSLTLILGPMKSGKSYELISYFAPLRYTNISYQLYQPAKHVRDTHIMSRAGSLLEGKKITSLKEVLEDSVSTVGIDEFHMFTADEIWVVEKLLQDKKNIFISSLDTDYRGHLFEVVAHLLSLSPKGVKFRRAVCDVCKIPEGTNTQILSANKPVLGNLPSIVPEDGTFTYLAVCRDCFVREPREQKKLFV